jgi:hypothetical protein
MSNITREIKNAAMTHTYDVSVLTKEGSFGTWEIDAKNRDQAVRIAEREGAQVRSVNMIG